MKKYLFLTLLFMPLISNALPTVQQIEQHGILSVPQVIDVYNKAKAGDAFSQANLGEGLLNGSIGVLPNHERALYWLNKAAAKGNALAYFNLAIIYLKGDAVPTNEDKFYKYVRLGLKAYEQQKNKYTANQRAVVEYMVGNLYYWGAPGVVDQNFSKAFAIYLDSANLGFAHAIKRVIFMYRNGIGVKQNFVEAHKWSLLLAQVGDDAAQYEAGIDYLDGVGVNKDNKEGLKWIRKSAIDSYYPAIVRLLELHKQGIEQLKPATEKNLLNLTNTISANIQRALRNYPLAKI